MRKMIALLLALTLIPISAGICAAAEQPQVSAADDVFSQMGLGGMQTISDEQGMQVRGKGFRGHGGFKIQVQVNVAVVHAYKSFVYISQSNTIH